MLIDRSNFIALKCEVDSSLFLSLVLYENVNISAIKVSHASQHAKRQTMINCFFLISTSQIALSQYSISNLMQFAHM